MGNGLQMIRKNASSIEALVVKLQTIRNRAMLAFVKKPVSHQQIPPHPNASIAVGLSDGKNPAARHLVNGDPDFIPARPMRDISFRANAPNVFFVRDCLKMGRIYATSISAQMVKLKAIWNGAVKLFPKPDVTEAQPPVAANSSVTVSMPGAHFPAAGI